MIWVEIDDLLNKLRSKVLDITYPSIVHGLVSFGQLRHRYNVLRTGLNLAFTRGWTVELTNV